MRILLVVCLLLAPWGVVFGAEEPVIPSFDARITVYEEGSMDVAERIVYQFNEERHGIFRYIPYSYQAQTATYIADITAVSVHDGEGVPVLFQSNRANGELMLKIGDKDTVVSGEQVYVITYKVSGPFLYFEEQDELYWNVTGNWPNGIESASLLVDLPQGKKVLTAACFRGAGEGAGGCDTDERLLNATQAGYTATASNLAPGESMAFAVVFPKGVIAQTLKPWEEQNALAWLVNVPGITFVPFLVPILLGMYFLYVWQVRGRDVRKKKTVAEQTMAPADMAPSLASALYYERIEPRELAAEILRLAVDGYLVIYRFEKEAFFATVTDYLFMRSNEHMPEDPTRAYLLQVLFEERYQGEEVLEGKTVCGALLSKMLHNFTDVQDSFTNMLYEEVYRRKYFVAHPKEKRRACIGAGAVSIVLGLVIWYFVASSTFGLTSALALWSTGVLLLVAGRWMPAYTHAGAQAKETLEGLRRYLQKHDHADVTEQEYNDNVPFALALGVEKEWSARCVDAVPDQPMWYVTGGAFSMTAFVLGVQQFVADCTVVAVSAGDEVLEGEVRTESEEK